MLWLLNWLWCYDSLSLTEKIAFTAKEYNWKWSRDFKRPGFFIQFVKMNTYHESLYFRCLFTHFMQKFSNDWLWIIMEQCRACAGDMYPVSPGLASVMSRREPHITRLQGPGPGHKRTLATLWIMEMIWIIFCFESFHHIVHMIFIYDDI